MKTRSSSAFTLIETVTAMAIILILTGLVISISGYVQKKGSQARAQGEIAMLGAASESYKADNGDYPTNGNTDLSTNALYGVLAPPSGKVYFEFPKGMVGSTGIIDPFGQLYQYRYPGDPTRSGSKFFDLYSSGGSSANPSNTWIKNW